MKSVFTVLLGAIVIMYLWFGIKQGREAFENKAKLNKEVYNRISAEEQLEQARQKLTSLEADLKRANKKIATLETLRKEEKLKSEELKDRLKNTEKAVSEKEQQEQPLLDVTTNSVNDR